MHPTGIDITQRLPRKVYLKKWHFMMNPDDPSFKNPYKEEKVEIP